MTCRALLTVLSLMLWVSPQLAAADVISFQLTSTTVSASAGADVVVFGSVTNNSGAALNASDFFFNFSGFDPSSLTPSQDLGATVDFPIPSGTTSAVVDLFNLAISASPSATSLPIQIQLQD
jgi:hypothetical protein